MGDHPSADSPLMVHHEPPRRGSRVISSPKTQPMMIRQKSFYEIIKVQDIHGPFRKAIPVMPVVIALLCCILNIVIPGSGTLVSSFTLLCGAQHEHDTKWEALRWNLLSAFLQVIMTIILVGYIWSLYWAVLFVLLAVQKPTDLTQVPSRPTFIGFND